MMLPSREALLNLLETMQNRRILVYGDVVVDRFLYGTPKRISREAPVLILRQEREDLVPGGGGNAVNNIRSLGGVPVPVGLVGSDREGGSIIDQFERQGIDCSGIVRVPRYQTPAKTRVLAGMPHASLQQVVRIDVESELAPDQGSFERLRELLRAALERTDAVLISDYGYGSVRREIVAEMVAQPSRIVTLDSRFDLLEYPGITAATPNAEEAAEATGISLFGPDADEIVREAGEQLRRQLGSPALLITRGSRGMALFEEGTSPQLIPVHGSDQIADVTGAGDTVIATFTLALAAGGTFLEAATLANYAGSIVVMKMGTATAGRDELRDLVENHHPCA